MTPVPNFDPAPAAPPRAGGGTPPKVGAGVSDIRETVRTASMGLLAYLASCNRCIDAGGFAEVFLGDEAKRDEWAAQHVADTGHVVVLSIDGLDGAPDLHLTGIICRDQHSEYRFVCPAEACAVSCGPYPSAAVAIASWRQHPIPQKASA